MFIYGFPHMRVCVYNIEVARVLGLCVTQCTFNLRENKKGGKSK